MKIEAFFGQPIKNIQKALEEKNIIINDTNGNSIFDKGDQCQYIVQDKDTLFKLSRLFDGVEVDDIRKNNESLKNTNVIHEGDRINIPFVIEQANDSNKNEPVQTSPASQQTPQVPEKKPQIPEKKPASESPFGNIKTKKIENQNILKGLRGNSVEVLKNGGYYVVDTNNNGIFDDGEELHKQVTIMLDAGHGSGEELESGQKVILPENKQYTTKVNDTFERIAKVNNIDIETLKKMNPNLKFSRDSGAIPPKDIGTNDEATITGIARDELRSILEEQGFRVIDNIRTDHANLANRQKGKLRVKPDMFISLHCDSFAVSSANGETVCYNPATEEDKKFAQAVNDALRNDTTFKNRDMQQRPKLCVLKGDSQGRIAEILVEMGFISNKEDYDNLNNSDTRKKQLEAIAQGVLNYYENEIRK